MTDLELTSDEFVVGYISTLPAPHSTWDVDLMIRLLQMVMLHSVKYSWESERALFQDIGVQVEKGRLECTDAEGIRELRFTHSRPRATERKIY